MVTPNTKSYGVPIYGADWLPLNLTKSLPNDNDSGDSPPPIDAGGHVILAGGGGEGRSGIRNALLVSRFDYTSNTLSDQPVCPNLYTSINFVDYSSYLSKLYLDSVIYPIDYHIRVFVSKL